MKKLSKPLKISLCTMIIIPTIASVLSGPIMWNISEVLFLFSGLIALLAFAYVENELAAFIGCVIVWIIIFLLPIKLKKSPKIRIFAYVLQGIFSVLNAIVGMLIIGGKYV